MERFETQAVNLDHEVNLLVTANGDVWYTEGIIDGVHPEQMLDWGYTLEGAYSYHNHPARVTYFSLSEDDIGTFMEHRHQFILASDYRYRYWMERTPETVEMGYEEAKALFKDVYITEVRQMAWDLKIDMDRDGYHETMKILSERLHFKYEREEKNV